MKKHTPKKDVKKDKKIRIAIIAVLCVCLVSLLSIYIVKIVRHQDVGKEGGELSSTNTAPYIVPPLTKKYENATYGFSLSIPEDFSIRESGIPDTNTPSTNESHTIVFENSKKAGSNEGIQIVISPYDQKGVKKLTKEMIQSAIPDMNITDEQVLEIGNSYTGLAFKSDNDAFDGNSREVWFIYKDNLYQISTYSRLDDLLKGIFATWEFK